jgi:hypothetical protein
MHNVHNALDMAIHRTTHPTKWVMLLHSCARLLPWFEGAAQQARQVGVRNGGGEESVEGGVCI